MSKQKQEQKPVDVMIDETRNKVVRTLNDSGLSIGIMAMMLRELSADVTQQAQAQLQALKQQTEQPKEAE